MSSLTEIALFKACAEQPRVAKDFTELNMDKIKDPYNREEMTEEEYLRRKALKLYHMAWSAITKYLRTTCIVHCKPVEIQGFGVFVPEKTLKGENADGRDGEGVLPQSLPTSPPPSKLTPLALNQLGEEEFRVKLCLQ